jgi:hypothetical protein
MVKQDLMEDVACLVRSLGYRATLREFRARLNGSDAGPMWRVQFPSAGHRPFRLERKNVAIRRLKASRSRYNAIVSIEQVLTRPTRCITVAHESGCYLAGRGFTITHNTAQEAFQRVLALVTNTDDLRKKVHKITNAHGEEGIQLKSGQRLRFVARSSGSGRGFTADRIILDEAYALTAAQMAALMPTLSARPNTQINYYSTPPQDEAAFLCGLRARGKAGGEGLAYLDWGAELNMLSPTLADQISDPELWYATNPALGIRISETAIRRELAALPPEEFARERLGVWPASSAGSVIDPEQWGRLADLDSGIDGAMALAVDITPSRDYSCIAAYGLRADGTGHMEIIEHLPGTDWVIRRLNALRDRWKPVAIGIDSKGPAGSLLTELEKQGYTKPEDAEDPAYGDLLIPTAAEVAASCGQLLDSITQGTVRHIDQTRLNTAVVGAKTRPLGEAWGWGRKVSGTDISPLVAATLARYAWESRAHLVADRDYELMDSIGF